LLLQTINEIDDAEKRMKAIHILLEKVEEEKEKEKEIDILKVEVEKEKVEKEKVEKEKNVLKVEKEKDVFQERLIKLEEDLLRAKGLMTARVVFERVVQLADAAGEVQQSGRDEWADDPAQLDSDLSAALVVTEAGDVRIDVQ
jgi:uncharacterized protein (DUF3084 family)